MLNFTWRWGRPPGVKHHCWFENVIWKGLESVFFSTQFGMITNIVSTVRILFTCEELCNLQHRPLRVSWPEFVCPVCWFLSEHLNCTQAPALQCKLLCKTGFTQCVCLCVSARVCDYTWTLCSVMMSRCPSYASLSCSVPKEQNKVPFDAQSGKLRPKCLHLLQTNLPPRSNSLSADVLCYPAPAVWPLTYTIGIVHRDTQITHRGNMGIISVTLLTIIHTYHVRMGSERFWKS